MEEACTNFRAYLHSSGVAEALSMALLSLYKLNKKPANPIEFIRQHLPPEQAETIAGLTSQLEDLKKDIEKLRKMLPKDVVPEIIQGTDGTMSLDGTETFFSDITSTVAETVVSGTITEVGTESVYSEATAATGTVTETVVSKATTSAPDTASISSKTKIKASDTISIGSKATTKAPDTVSTSSKATTKSKKSLKTKK